MNVNEIKLKVLQIMALALEISPPDKGQQTKDAPHVFLEYFPHVPALYAKVYLHGWTDSCGADPDKKFDIYTSEKANYGDSIDDLFSYLTELQDEVKRNA